tara:strand:- start:427 stop:696 length:270 start_codon:yes stop_codon:yes gene_type:complete
MIKKLNKEILKYINKNPQIKEYQKTQKIMNIIPQNIHKGIAELSIKKTQLTIKTKSPSWRQEISFLKKEIIKKIDKKLPNYNIKEIKVL